MIGVGWWSGSGDGGSRDCLQTVPVLEETFHLESLGDLQQVLNLLLPHRDLTTVDEVQQGPGLIEGDILRQQLIILGSGVERGVLPLAKLLDVGKWSPSKRCGNMERKRPELSCGI